MTVSLPVVGDVNYYSSVGPEQSGVEEFEQELQKLWETGVTAVVWRQYTPYFNDGDVCVFGASGDVYSVDELDNDDISEAPIYGDYDDELGAVWQEVPWNVGFTWDRNLGKYVEDADKPAPSLLAAHNFFKQIDSGEFNEVLLRNFGDPAKVVATPGAFYVEHFDHD